MLVYKDILKMLREAGYSSYRLRNELCISPSTIQRLQNGESVNTKTIELICELLHCQPGDIMEMKYEKDEELGDNPTLMEIVSYINKNKGLLAKKE